MKNNSRAKNDYISLTKRILSAVIVAVILCTIVCVMAEGNTINYIPYSTTGYTTDGANLWISDSGGQVYVTCNQDNVIYFKVTTENRGTNNSINYFVCSNTFSEFEYYPSLNLQHTFSNAQFNSTYNLYYYTNSATDISINENNPYVYHASSMEDAFQQYIEMTGVTPGYPINYTLPAGNIAYLEIDTTLFNGVNLATIMPELSGVGSSDPWSLSSQFYAMTDDMLTNGTSVYDLNGTRIVWNKSPNASTNLLGQTDHAVWESQGPYPNKTYFVICNPFYFFDNENNSSITIVANGIKNVYVQPLKTVVQQNGNEISYNTTVDGGTYEGVVTDDLGPIEWTDPDGGNTAPGTSTSNTPVAGINQFQQWLQGILQQIISVFEPAHDAITTLASAVQNFSGWLRALYVWLPSPVLNLLTSAISLAIIIGVIKVFI